VRDPPLEPKAGGNLAACHYPLADAAVSSSSPDEPR
jgi:hypothetical protein